MLGNNASPLIADRNPVPVGCRWIAVDRPPVRRSVIGSAAEANKNPQVSISLTAAENAVPAKNTGSIAFKPMDASKYLVIEAMSVFFTSKGPVEILNKHCDSQSLVTDSGHLSNLNLY